MKKFIIVFISLLMSTFLLTACSGGGSKNITIGAVTYTETKILAHMYKELIEAETDISVDIKEDLATSFVVLDALAAEDLDMATIYTGTLTNLTEVDNPQDPQAVWEQGRDFFAGDEHKSALLEPLGFANTFAFTVREDIAEEYDLEKISDLEGIAEQFSAGFDTGWLEREHDGYPDFIDTYQLEFADTNPMQYGLVYDAVKNGDVDIVLAYSTDARITAFDLVMLEDDKQFFPPFDAAPIIRQELLDEYPELEEIIEPLIGRFTEKSIGQLNGKVDLDKEKIADVAYEYLKNENLIE